MKDLIYRHLAAAFVKEGTEACFSLMGDGNMHFATALDGFEGVRSIFVRHEHCAPTMAAGYARASGKVGVASVTCGPGLTQIMTALAVATAAGIPLVVFAGESPIDAAWYNQKIDQAPLVTATGAHYIACHSKKLMQTHVREAFYVARTQNRPVVLGVPHDLQNEAFDFPDYVPSTQFLPAAGRMHPDPAAIAAAADLIEQSSKVVLIGGRGVLLAGAAQTCRDLAERTDALLTTTLPARGLFHDDPFTLGVAGGFSGELTREKLQQADLVIAIGASMTSHTTDGGKLFAQAKVMQIDENPTGIRHSRKTADCAVRGDARVAVEALLAELDRRGLRRSATWRSPETRQRIASWKGDDHPFEIENGTVDTRQAVASLDAALPRDWTLVNGAGHSSQFTVEMRGRPARTFITIREFGAIGNALCHAVGAAVARPDETIVLIDGDGGFLMHVQELETISRYGFRILMCIINDGAYGPEIHKLRADGLSDAGAVFGRGDLGRLAQGFGIDGRVITDTAEIAEALGRFKENNGPALWDIHVSQSVVSPYTRRSLSGAGRH